MSDKRRLVVSNGIKDTNLKANHNMVLWHIEAKTGIKDTNLKANHNYACTNVPRQPVVSNGIKDTNLKANHNRNTTYH